MNSSPSQKTGIETPASASSIRTVSSQVFWRSPASTPSVIPNRIASAIAETARAIVFGSRSPISLMTGRFVWTDRPRSPCTALNKKSPNWT